MAGAVATLRGGRPAAPGWSRWAMCSVVLATLLLATGAAGPGVVLARGPTPAVVTVDLVVAATLGQTLAPLRVHGIDPVAIARAAVGAVGPGAWAGVRRGEVLRVVVAGDDPGRLIAVFSLAHPERLGAFRHHDGFRDCGGVGVSGVLGAPLQGRWMVTSSFGARRSPVGKGANNHRGIDLGVPTGTPVFSAAEGVVVEVGRHRRAGLLVRVAHGKTVVTTYAHLSAARVRVGERVKRDQVLALTGVSGRVTGPHLHFEVAVAGKAIDPATIFPFTSLGSRDRVQFERWVEVLRARPRPEG